MSAAQKSRDAILAKIASGCASEVQKAKERAEETRRKREEDKKRVMLESRERLQEAEKRRQEVLKERGKRRSRSGSNGREEAMQRRKEEAARRIQTWWRKRRDEQTVEGFKALGIRTEIVEQADFIEISARLMEAEVLKATGKLLRRLGFVEGTDTTAVDNACRCFLSAFLILTHPTEVLSMDGDMERVCCPPLVLG